MTRLFHKMSPHLTILFILLQVLIRSHFILSRTLADDHRTHIADIKLLKGAFLGKVEFVQAALAHANTGNVNAVMTREIGEHFLKLGRAGFDFPVAPALHIALSGGTREHMQVAHLLLMRGADPNLVCNSTFPSFPAVYYALGAFAAPSSAQAAILQKMFQTFAAKFRPAATRLFVRQTGRPPPLHAAVLQNFFDGAHLLSSTEIYDVDERDAQGLTALHVAAWLGNTHMVLLLLHNGASPDALDPFHRTFLHYLACRGMFSLVHTLLLHDESTVGSRHKSPLSEDMKQRLLTIQDDGEQTALDIALMPPAQFLVANEFLAYQERANMNMSSREEMLSNFSHPDIKFPENSIDLKRVEGFSPIDEGEKCEPREVTRENRAGHFGCDDDDAKWFRGICQSSYHGQRNGITPKNLSIIATREWTSLSEADFRFQFLYPQRPLKLIGNFTSKMNIWKHLERKSFSNRYGSLSLNISDKFGVCVGDNNSCSSNVFDYLERSIYFENDVYHVVRGTEEEVPESKILVGSMTVLDDELSQDLLLPQKFFSVCGLPAPLPGSTRLHLMSGTHVVSPMRSESAMWNVLLAGSERHWYLLSPGVALNMSSPNTDGRFQFQANGDFSYWVKKIFPQLRSEGLVAEVVQRAGDVVFIPFSWAFVISARGSVVDFSHNFCVLPHSPSVFGQVPVGIRMYGHLSA